MIDTLFRHNLWANTRLFDVCAGLTEAQLGASIVGAYGTIRDTLIHIANGERSYLHRITTGKPYRRAADAPTPTLDELRASVKASGEGLIAAAPRVEADDFVVMDWEGQLTTVPSVIILTQAINHATEHRAQIMATLTQLGIKPPDLDGWTYSAAYE